ncbi:hypothetical protein ACHAXM_010551 [Skeletonema potamos]
MLANNLLPMPREEKGTRTLDIAANCSASGRPKTKKFVYDYEYDRAAQLHNYSYARPALAVVVVLSFFILLQLNSVHFTIAKTTHVATIENSFREEQNYRYSRHQVQGRCEALKLHQMGRWQHYFFADNTDSLNDEMSNRIRNSYTPLELEWLAGNSSSWMEESVKTEGCAQYRDTHGLMITAKLGNQCSCASSAFRPSHSVWINELRPTDGGADADVVLQSPSLRLVERLARENRSLCFMGDSVDNQFYDALRLNLERTLLIKSNYSSFIQKIQAEKIPLNYTNETGPSLYTEGKTRYASHMMRTIITLGENLDKATFKYMRHYGWAPGDTSFLDDCDIVVTNLGLHYEPYSGKLVNPYKSVTAIPNLGPSILASVTYLADFASLDSKISVWRSALPQHFDTPDGRGHYNASRSSWDDHVCTALKSARNYSQYNRIYKEKFSELKPINESSEEGVCGAYESKVRVNRTSLDLPTVYRYYLEKNCCKEKRERLERLREQGDANVTGTVLRWEIADLFDVPSWHSADRDCTHFCYIPALYEAAFERLDLLIPPL